MKTDPRRVVIVGGGYSGMATALQLLRKKKPKFEVHVLDRVSEHLLLTNLHKTVQSPLTRFQISFSSLAKRFGFHFHRAEVPVTVENLGKWQEAGRLKSKEIDLPFDYLVVNTGSRPINLEHMVEPSLANESVFSDHYFRQHDISTVLDEHIRKTGQNHDFITLVGLGSTSLQFMFEIEEYMRKRKRHCTLRMVGMESRFQPEFAQTYHRYILQKCGKRNIGVFFRTRMLGHTEGKLQVENIDTGEKQELVSNLTLLFPGVKGNPLELKCNANGQAEVEGRPLGNVYASGDCSTFNSGGLNRMSGQAAVRKGKHVADNIARAASGSSLKRYGYQELGYFLSLGSFDGIGWMLVKQNIITGLPAFLIKESIETQFEVLLAGVDTYL